MYTYYCTFYEDFFINNKTIFILFCVYCWIQYVLKRINLQRTSKREHTSAEQEARLLQKLRHPNIVSYKHSFETPDGMLFIAMQYCEGGDLYTKLKSQNGVLLQENQVVEWFIQIAMALQVGFVIKAIY